MRLISTGVLVFALTALAQADAALAVYEQGKVAYDAKRFDEALAKFDEAARLEPQKARWQYNRGLALRKLKRDQQAREAFLESLRLDPEYKKDEIREKLGQLEPPPSTAPAPDPGGGEAPHTASPSSTADTVVGLIICAVFLAVPIGIIALVVRAFRRAKTAPPAQQQSGSPVVRPGMTDAALQPLRAQLASLGPRLLRLEHAMSLGEDAEARGHLERAYTNYLQLKRGVQRRQGTVQELAAAHQRAADAASAAEQRLRALRGAAFDTAQGPKVGCFFCARPLPTPESRHGLSLTVRGQPSQVVACATCARRAASDDAPTVTMVDTGRGWAHWASLNGIDPYEFSFGPTADTREAPLGQLSKDGADVSTLAALAGAAVAGAAVGAVVSRALDVDSLAESLAASGAAEAAARSASGRRAERDWKDHS